MLGLAYLMNYSGMTSTLGLALATSGGAFPFFSAMLGWLGVFLTGSDTSANALFGNLQVVTANALNLNPVLTASVNSAAGVMGKMISVQSIAVAVAATGMTRSDESRLFRFTIKHSVFLMVVMGIISMLFAYVFPGSVPVAPPEVDARFAEPRGRDTHPDVCSGVSVCPDGSPVNRYGTLAYRRERYMGPTYTPTEDLRAGSSLRASSRPSSP